MLCFSSSGSHWPCLICGSAHLQLVRGWVDLAYLLGGRVRPLPPGRYQISVDLLKASCLRFSEIGSDRCLSYSVLTDSVHGGNTGVEVVPAGTTCSLPLVAGVCALDARSMYISLAAPLGVSDSE